MELKAIKLLLFAVLFPILSITQENEKTTILRKYILRNYTHDFYEKVELKNLNPVINNILYKVSNKNLNVPFGEDYSLFDFISLRLNEDKILLFDSCTFRFSHPLNVPLPDILNIKSNLVFQNSDIIDLSLSNLSNECRFINSKLYALFLKKLDNCTLHFIDCTLDGFIGVKDSRNIKLNFGNTGLENSSFIRLDNSSIEEFNYTEEDSLNSIIFINDTLNGNFSNTYVYWNDKKLKNKIQTKRGQRNIQFKNCYINSSFSINNLNNNLTIEFINCNFGPHANLLDLSVNNISFISCRFPDQPIPLSFDPKLKVNFNIQNTEIENLSFNFSKNINIVDSNWKTAKDQANYTYQLFLEKFRKEGKKESFKLIDIEYHKFNDSSIWNFINSSWWYYGYKPGRVFLWTIFFILAFFIFNHFFWKEMLEAYPLLDKSKVKLLPLKKLSTVFLYTIFIFFSLKVNLDKLNFKNHRFIYVFLFQYIVGLWCILFIIKYVFGI